MIGFEHLTSKLTISYNNNKLPHAILLDGKKGIGKASFTKKLAEDLLGSRAAFNTDALVIKKDEDKKEITVEKIRQTSDFVNQTSAISGKKFIIIDSACNLNKSASNAILKILEEPKDNNFFILISHNLGKVLPTIRSRCQLIKAPDFTKEDTQKILNQNDINIPKRELDLITEICDNSPAEIIGFGIEISRFYELFLRSLLNKKLSDELLNKISDKNFSFIIYEKSFEFFSNRLLKSFFGLKVSLFGDEKEVFNNLKQKLSREKILSLVDESMIILHKSTPLYLNKKLTLINIFNKFSFSR